MIRTTCPRCGLPSESTRRERARRRTVYAFHVYARHPDLGVRQRSLLADEMVRREMEVPLEPRL